jgi:hypothetical protein
LQGPIFLWGESPHENVWIETGIADHGEDFPVPGIESNERRRRGGVVFVPTPTAMGAHISKSLLGRSLELSVQSEDEIVSRGRRTRGHGWKERGVTATRVDLDVSLSIDAPEDGFVLLLDSGLSDQIPSFVVAGLTLFEILNRNFSEKTEDVTGQVTSRVTPNRNGFDANAGKSLEPLFDS